MTLPHSVHDVIADHVRFSIECVDRMYLNVYQPKLQYEKGLVGYIRGRLGLPIPSTAVLADKTRAFDKAVHQFANSHHIEWIDFKKGQRKDDIMKDHLAVAGDGDQVLFIGRAQEKARLFRTEKRHRDDGTAYPWIVQATGMVNHFYFYCLDQDFGPLFIKYCSYFPYTARLCINGHEWAKRQADQAGIGYTALDNGFAAVDDVAAIQAICDRFGPTQVDALLRKWLTLLPCPYDLDDDQAGYRYDISILQAEFSLTQMLDAPVAGRVFFEQVIRDNLDIGRPSQVSLIFNKQIRLRGKHPTPSRWRTRVITAGVTPSLHLDYKHSTIKQYHKEGQALRTETTINNTLDFGIGKRLTNLPALSQIGFTANRRLLDVQRLHHDPAQGAALMNHVTRPATTENGTRVAGLRFDDPRAHDLYKTLIMFRTTQPDGFTNPDLRQLLGELAGTPVSPGRVTYDLRRLAHHGFITRRPHSRRYDVTDDGLAQALFLTRAADRVLRTGMAQLADTQPNPLNTATRAYQKALDRLAHQASLSP